MCEFRRAMSDTYSGGKLLLQHCRARARTLVCEHGLRFLLAGGGTVAAVPI